MTEILEQALAAFERGWTPIPLVPGQKRPALASWQRVTYDSAEEVTETFRAATESHGDGLNLGLSLGEPSGGLVDVDLDNHTARRLARLCLPETAMQTGRASSRFSHFWYVCDGDCPEGTERFQGTDRGVLVELRTTGGQTVVPPSTHTSGEAYVWEGTPWGGSTGPALVNGRVLAARVATLAMATLLVDHWPGEGGRHAAYLALAGGLLRYGGVDGDTGGVHPLWEHALPGLIGALAEATHDEDGAEARISETVESTIKKLRSGQKVSGFPSLASLIGDEAVTLVVRYARRVEAVTGHATRAEPEPLTIDLESDAEEDETPADYSHVPLGERDPLAERRSSWERVDLLPYLSGDVSAPSPGILFREDGLGLIYPGRINSIYGASESGKSWLALAAAAHVINDGERVLYLDFEDEPLTQIERALRLGLSPDDIADRFIYVRPEDAVAPMARNRWGEESQSEKAWKNRKALIDLLDLVQPTLVIADGLTALYGLHNLSTNDASNTDVITSWLKSLTNGGRTVLMIDHTSKGAQPGALPTGSQHKIAMVQGAALQVCVTTRPRPGHVGEVRIYIGKDRPGQIRAGCTDDGEAVKAADVTIDSTDENRTIVRLQTPDQSTVVIADSDKAVQRLTRLKEDAEAITHALRTGGGEMSKAEIMLVLKVRLTQARWRDAINALIADGVIEKSGETRGARYRLLI